jgi:hypothetical protein
MLFEDLSDRQKNIICASVIADGEITKCYQGSRRKNNSYREHFSIEQLEYRRWKESYFPEILYLRNDQTNLVSKSIPLFTQLYNSFYTNSGDKRIPTELLQYCTLPHFIATLYLDDGSLCISKRINNRKKLIYLTPHICLYLQNFPRNELIILQQHLNEHFKINFRLNKRKDGFGYILKLTKVEEAMKFLNIVRQAIDCPSMKYKYDWDYRLQLERGKLTNYEGYTVIASDSMRSRNYSQKEILQMISLKKDGISDKEISQILNRSYWSIVYKLKEIRKDGHL